MDSEVERTAKAEADNGHVVELLDIMRGDIPRDSRKNIINMLPEALENAVKNGRVTDALEVLGAEDILLSYQILAIDTITQNGKTSWMSSVFESRKLPGQVEKRILDNMAKDGLLSDLLNISNQNISSSLRLKVQGLISTCVNNTQESEWVKLSKEDLIKVARILSVVPQSNRKLGMGGVLSEGTVKKPGAEKKGIPQTLKR